mmetsp:Transcript_38313/g.66600  ORF Transcript_38313/g.66600 Transcript_38313/m.66600 type:complete len:211 (+) Transcript_38313:130-762(+)
MHEDGRCRGAGATPQNPSNDAKRPADRHSMAGCGNTSAEEDTRIQKQTLLLHSPARGGRGAAPRTIASVSVAAAHRTSYSLQGVCPLPLLLSSVPFDSHHWKTVAQHAELSPPHVQFAQKRSPPASHGLLSASQVPDPQQSPLLPTHHLQPAGGVEVLCSLMTLLLKMSSQSNQRPAAQHAVVEEALCLHGEVPIQRTLCLTNATLLFDP